MFFDIHLDVPEIPLRCQKKRQAFVAVHMKLTYGRDIQRRNRAFWGRIAPFPTTSTRA